MSKKYWEHYAWAPNGRQIYVPDTLVVTDKPSYYALPLRGSSVLAVWDQSQGRFVGWLAPEALGFSSAKEFMASPKYRKDILAQFID